jgi:hypothetical protein
MTTRKTTHDRAVAQRAKRMWQDDGRPAGRLDEYLERSRELQAIIDNPTAGLLPNPMTAHYGQPGPDQPVEEAELMENLGEFPSRLGDQGDHAQTPMSRRRARQLAHEK